MYNPFSLKDKTILITGASSGIGMATAVECSRMGARVVITARNEERLINTLNLLSGDGHSYFVGDMTEDVALDNLVDLLPALDGVVNNAGVTKTVPVQFIKKKAIDDILSVNTVAPILLTQQLTKKKKIRQGGSIVFTSSISGIYCSSVASSLYSTSKGAINGFIKGVALDLAPRGIRVNSVNPGMIDTNIYSEGFITKEQLELDMLKYPLKRYGKPEEVAYAIIYFLSDASKWVTGSNLLIDGGYTLL